jgi:choline monooxygenase
LIFVNPDLKAEPLHEALGPLPDLVASVGVNFDELRFRERAAYGDEYDIAANWKIVIENGLECYHCPVAHPALSRIIEVEEEKFVLEAFDKVSMQRGMLRPSRRSDGHGQERTRFYNSAEDIDANNVFFLWPYFTLNTWPGRTNMNLILFAPEDVNRTRVIMDFFFADDVTDEEARGYIDFLSAVGREDQAIVESVQAGISSGLYEHGTLLPRSEHLMLWFQALVRSSLREDSQRP